MRQRPTSSQQHRIHSHRYIEQAEHFFGRQAAPNRLVGVKHRGTNTGNARVGNREEALHSGSALMQQAMSMPVTTIAGGERGFTSHHVPNRE
jgi:hypothetical protein